MSHIGKSVRLLLSSLVIGVCAPTFAATTGTQVAVETGTLKGKESDGVIAFKGVPFAAPPVADLRWRAPQPAAHWEGVRDAGEYGPDCMQVPFPSDAAPLGTKPAEDCLYLNVWRPAGKAENLPVMVWIYGGGFVNGGASPPTYSGAELAKQGVVVVSFNYRVGRFGTFAHPQIDPALDGGVAANYGFLDQLAALKWVQRNIAGFGGAPGNVTIIGESAGGMSVNTLLSSPLTANLFHKAVVQSGGDGNTRATVDEARQASLAFARGKGIADNDPQALQKLRALSADEVTDGLNMMALFMPSQGPRTFSSPVADGTLAVDSGAAFEAGRFNKVPVMIGATSNDIGGRDGFMVAGARTLAGTIARHGVPVHYYRFSYVADSARTPQTAGADHATEIPFFFGTLDAKYGAKATERDRAASALASGYLVNFVKTGDPNGRGLPKWPAYESASHTMLDFAADGTATAGRDPWAQ